MIGEASAFMPNCLRFHAAIAITRSFSSRLEHELPALPLDYVTRLANALFPSLQDEREFVIFNAKWQVDSDEGSSKQAN